MRFFGILRSRPREAAALRTTSGWKVYSRFGTAKRRLVGLGAIAVDARRLTDAAFTAAERAVVELLLGRRRPLGIQAIASRLGVDLETLRDVREPRLERAGLTERTEWRRVATEEARELYGRAGKGGEPGPGPRGPDRPGGPRGPDAGERAGRGLSERTGRERGSKEAERERDGDRPCGPEREVEQPGAPDRPPADRGPGLSPRGPVAHMGHVDPADSVAHVGHLDHLGQVGPVDHVGQKPLSRRVRA